MATTVNVLVKAFDQQNNPVSGAAIVASLSHADIDPTYGYVLPEDLTATTDINGQATFALWPNQLGSTASYYVFKITNPDTEKMVRIEATIPNANCELHLVANLPPYPGKLDGQLAIDAAVAAVIPAVAAKDAAIVAQGAAEQAAQETAADVLLTHADVLLTHADVVATGQDRVQTGLDRAAAETARTQAQAAEAGAAQAVTLAINNILDGAPAALDTLNELAAALNDDANFATSVASSLAAKEPTITGGTIAQYWRGDKTWRDFFADVRDVTLTGLSTATNAVIAATDTVLGALGKLQKQVSDNLASLTTHTSDTANPHGVTKAQVGLTNVEDKSSATIRSEITSANVTAALGFTPIDAAEKGVTVATLVGGTVPASQLPSFVDDVLEYADLASLPVTGEAGKIYVTLDDNKTYRWGVSAYVNITASPGSTDAVPEGATNLYFTAQRVRDTVLTGLSTATNAVISAADSALSAFGKLQKQISDNLTALANHAADTANPHSVTKAQVGLGNVDNTADVDKPVSTAQQTAINAKLDKLDGVATNSLQIVASTASTDVTLAMSSLAGNYGSVSFRTNQLDRWFFGKSASAEAGANAGSNFFIGAFDDAGAYLGNALSILRATQVVNFDQTPTVAGAAVAKLSDVTKTQVGLATVAVDDTAFNYKMGASALNAITTGTNNVGIGASAFSIATSASNNVVIGHSAGNTGSTAVAVTGSNNVIIGSQANFGATGGKGGGGSYTVDSGRITLIGAGASAGGLTAITADAYMTAIGSGAVVNTANTVVLGRTTDATVIGASADDLSGAKLQVTGAIKATSYLGLNLPQNSQSANYTAVAGDSGKHLLHPSADTTARTFTIPDNATVPYAIGTQLHFVNQDSAGTMTIAITNDTMRLAGSGATGSRTLAANGIATAVKLTATEWLIHGTNLT